MATITIFVNNKDKLELDDNGHSRESKGGNVIWHKGKGVDSIISVTRAEELKSPAPTGAFKTTEEFWGDNPPVKIGEIFKGTISENAESDSIWDYDIVTDVGSIDPRIQVI